MPCAPAQVDADRLGRSGQPSAKRQAGGRGAPPVNRAGQKVPQCCVQLPVRRQVPCAVYLGTHIPASNTRMRPQEFRGTGLAAVLCRVRWSIAKDLGFTHVGGYTGVSVREGGFRVVLSDASCTRVELVLTVSV